jgi:hypothetical protein
MLLNVTDPSSSAGIDGNGIKYEQEQQQQNCGTAGPFASYQTASREGGSGGYKPTTTMLPPQPPAVGHHFVGHEQHHRHFQQEGKPFSFFMT